MSTTIDNSNTHELHTTRHNLLDRIWSRLTSYADNTEITSDTAIKQQLLREQQQIELQNQARRTADIHRMIMRHI